MLTDKVGVKAERKPAEKVDPAAIININDKYDASGRHEGRVLVRPIQERRYRGSMAGQGQVSWRRVG